MERFDGITKEKEMDWGTGLALCGVAVAIVQLRLQHDEIQLNGKINMLIYVSSMLKDKIELHEKIIADMKEKGGKDWSGHARRVNDDLKPLRKKVDQELLDAMEHHQGNLRMSDIRRALSME